MSAIVIRFPVKCKLGEPVPVKVTKLERVLAWLQQLFARKPKPAPLFKARNPHWVLAVRRMLRKAR